jgi:hypothetical protein
MTARFDGLRSILGSSAVAVPEVDAPVVDSTRLAAVAEAPIEAPSPTPPKAAPDSSLRPTSSVVDFPDLSDLDRGLYPADSAAVRSSRDRREIRPDDARVAALGRGLDFEPDDDLSEFGTLSIAPPRQWGTSRPSSSVRRRAAVQSDRDDASERRISGWAAVAAVVLGLFLGGAVAMAAFRDDVSHILASWDGPRVSSHSLRPQ